MDGLSLIKTACAMLCLCLCLGLLAGCATTVAPPSASRDTDSTVPPRYAATETFNGKGKLQQSQDAMRAVLTESIPPDLTVWFVDGQSEMQANSGQRLQELADKLKQDKQLDVQLTSKSPTSGSHSLCLAQAAAKLNTVASRLLQLGVQPYQIRQRNMGCEAALLAQAPCLNADCRPAKERVEIRLLK
jgi:hypothetical protein